MDSFGASQPTQATQNVVDPRRLGQQNSGFSDEDISDIICLLLPYSDAARQELKRIATENSQHMVGRDRVDGLRLDYRLEDEARNFARAQPVVGEHHIALRFSSPVKDPLQGFTFGRNPTRCDICLQNDPCRRLSNVHFRIYLNEWAVLMLEDQSTNGTVVDEVLLKKKDSPPAETKRTLNSGSKIKILMHEESRDLAFVVRIPLRDGPCQEAYQRNLDAYMADRRRLVADANKTIVPGPGGHVDIFEPGPPRNANAAVARRAQLDGGRGARQPPRTHADGLPRPWNGSNRYNLVCEIGRGAFASVYKVTTKQNGEPYAAKEIDKRKFMKNGVLDQKVENEMRIMQRVKHPNIVQYIEHIDWDDRLLIIVMEFVGGGDLGKLIAENGPLSESATKTMARQLLSALGYLHDMNITHRDVKPDNILIHSLDPFVVKLTDFGLSKMIDNEQTFLRTFCGTLLYCAPEVYSEFAEYDNRGRRHPRNRRLRPVTGPRYHHAVDIWSLGGVLFYALTNKPPFPARNGASHSELLHQIMTKPLNVEPLVEADISEQGIDFLRRMLDRRPETRATVESLLSHPWLAEPDTPVGSQEPDELSDEEELRVNASQLTIEDVGCYRADHQDLLAASDDEIPDEEEADIEGGEPAGYGSEKENYTLGPNNLRQRLFGEVNASAVGSSGAVPADRLNLPVSAGSSASTEVLDGGTEIKDSFESEDSLTPRPKSQKSQPPSGGLRSSILSTGQSMSVGELNNMTFDVASQSLGGAESILGNLNVKSRAGSLLRSHTTNGLGSSKRKPLTDSSQEKDMPSLEERRGLKRLRSDASAASANLVIDQEALENGEYELLAQIPSISRAQSGRQIDNPVHKSTFWSAQDRRTWHLRYPEMTQLQLDAFKLAAAARDEEFGPGKTPLWDLAMKYFPATNCERGSGASRASRNGRTEDGRLPSTASGDAPGLHNLPDTQDPEPQLVMPMQSDLGRPIVACLQSVPGSAISGISVMITESMVSWGRAPDNTRSYSPKSEGKVPKYAFKILLWKQGYDPAKNFRPWNRAPEADEETFHFYISTKATNGIHINGVHLPSDDCKNANGPSRYWMTLHDGDHVSIWQTADRSCRTELIFRCGWGGSARPRPQDECHRPRLVPDAVARKLDEVCARAERKMRSLSEHDLKMEEANHDVDERMYAIDRERQRSRDFELKRQEACRALGIVRRLSPAPGSEPAAATATTQAPWSSIVPGTRMVPNFRHASPTTLELLRQARRG